MLDSKGVKTPMVSTCKLLKQGNEYLSNPSHYRSIVGVLHYATLTRPNICYVVNKVCQFMAEPLQEHWQAVKHILKYLSGTVKYGIVIRPIPLSTIPLPISAYCDADWASDPNDRKSTSGSCILLGTNVVSWWSRKQLRVARSSTEAEYRSLADTTVGLLWIQFLLKELQVPFSIPRVYCDNLSTVQLAHNPVLHSRIKHMEIDLFFVREKVLLKQLTVYHIPSLHQIADVLTKPLSSSRFIDLKTKLSVIEYPNKSP
ncbi:unnamed protein product [Cuscuta europaea]|uniref:Copia protein n=1 Tax=Cuscuta europaea TaxID=41803 RepID=A0A9P0ZIR1_CUSEU|nr:unnamed protein product [Cuscuta europaea]